MSQMYKYKYSVKYNYKFIVGELMHPDWNLHANRNREIAQRAIANMYGASPSEISILHITRDDSENTEKKTINSNTSQADKEYREKVKESKERARLEKRELDREWDELEKRRKEKIEQQEKEEAEKKKRENDAINESIIQHAADRDMKKEAAKFSYSRFESRLKLPREWDSENLNTDVYRNGNRIIKANSKEDCIIYTEQQVGFYCYYNYLDSNARFGKLYNWYAINVSARKAAYCLACS